MADGTSSPIPPEISAFIDQTFQGVNRQEVDGFMRGPQYQLVDIGGKVGTTLVSSFLAGRGDPTAIMYAMLSDLPERLYDPLRFLNAFAEDIKNQIIGQIRQTKQVK